MSLSLARLPQTASHIIRLKPAVIGRLISSFDARLITATAKSKRSQRTVIWASEADLKQNKAANLAASPISTTKAKARKDAVTAKRIKSHLCLKLLNVCLIKLITSPYKITTPRCYYYASASVLSFVSVFALFFDINPLISAPISEIKPSKIGPAITTAINTAKTVAPILNFCAIFISSEKP